MAARCWLICSTPTTPPPGSGPTRLPLKEERGTAQPTDVGEPHHRRSRLAGRCRSAVREPTRRSRRCGRRSSTSLPSRRRGWACSCGRSASLGRRPRSGCQPAGQHAPPALAATPAGARLIRRRPRLRSTLSEAIQESDALTSRASYLSRTAVNGGVQVAPPIRASNHQHQRTSHQNSLWAPRLGTANHRGSLLDLQRWSAKLKVDCSLDS